jgi:hypothetical protein
MSANFILNGAAGWSILIIVHVLNSQICRCCNAHAPCHMGGEFIDRNIAEGILPSLPLVELKGFQHLYKSNKDNV